MYCREAKKQAIRATILDFQSNHEGELVDFLHQHIDDAGGAILNPAGLTQFGVSLHDAIKTMPFPVIEVHISNRHAREEWRHHSIISSAVKATVEGLGWRSYTSALRALVESSGVAWISVAQLAGRPALRACITSYRSTEEDVEALCAALAAARVTRLVP